MALKLDWTGLLVAPGGPDGATLAAAMPTAAAVKAAYQDAPPAWAKLPSETRHAQACLARVAAIQEEADVLVVLGIGGSALGASAGLAALAPYGQEWQTGGQRVFVLDSVDPDWMGGFLETVPADRLHVNVISKSGGTIETSADFLALWDHVRRACSSDEMARKRFTITTDPASGHFRKLCDDFGFATLEVPEGVGGRFSVLSAVGLFPFAFAGLDVESMLAGAAKTAANLAATGAANDPALAWALCHVLHLQAGRNVHVMFSYSWRARLLADWWQQLWAESLGKKLDTQANTIHVGPTPVSSLGPTDQHSQCQLYMEGPDDKVYTFLQVEKFQKEVLLGAPFADSPAFSHLAHRSFADIMDAERRGTQVALADAGRPQCTLGLCQMDAFHLGQFFQFFQVATAYAGPLLGVDPYDQPGVEAGKVAALALMGCAGFEERSAEIQAAEAARPHEILTC